MRLADGDAEVTALSQPAERVQAALFAAILRQEVEVMDSNVAKAEAQWRSRCHAKGHVVELPERLVPIRTRLAEAQRMLDALNTPAFTSKPCLGLITRDLRHSREARPSD